MEQQERIGVGGIISGRYRILSVLGKGGVGFVYLAEDAVLKGQKVAIKVLYPDHEEADFHRNRFFREVSLTRNLESPNIIRTYDVGQDGPALYYTMEVLEGETLGDFLKQRAATFEQALDMLVQGANGLEVIHNAEIIHRDVKPSNLFVTENGVVKLMDFGLARPENSQLTQSSATPGSAAYMPPEIWQGNTATKASDIYSFGVTIFEALSGQHPFPSDSVANMMYNHLRSVPPTLRDVVPDIPPKISQLVACMLEKAPEKRPVSITEVRESLQEVLDNKGRWKELLPRFVKSSTHAPRDVSVAAKARKRRRIFTSVYLMAGCGVLGVALGVISISLQREAMHVAPAKASGMTGAAQRSQKSPVLVPSEIRNAILWLDAGVFSSVGKNKGESVSNWQHASGDESKAGVKQAFEGWRPRYSVVKTIPVVSFDGKDDFLESPAVVAQLKHLDSMTVMVVLRTVPFVSETNPKRKRVVWSAQLSYSDMILARMGFSAANTVSMNLSSELKSKRIETQPIPGLRNFHLYVMRFSSDQFTLYLDGKLKKKHPILQPLAFGDVKRFLIGQDIDQIGDKIRFSDFFRGELAEFALLKKSISEAQRIVIERYYRDKYQLPF